MRKPSALRGKSRRSPTQSPRAALSAHMAFPVRMEPLARPSRKQPLRAPRRVLILAAVHETVVQPERAVAPEFDLERRHAKAAPVGRAGHFRERIFRRVFRDLLLERPASFHGPRLGRGPGTDLAVLGARGEIGVGFGVAYLCYGP